MEFRSTSNQNQIKTNFLSNSQPNYWDEYLLNHRSFLAYIAHRKNQQRINQFRMFATLKIHQLSYSFEIHNSFPQKNKEPSDQRIVIAIHHAYMKHLVNEKHNLCIKEMIKYSVFVPPAAQGILRPSIYLVPFLHYLLELI